VEGLKALKAELLDSIKKGVDFVNKGTPSSDLSFTISRDDLPTGGSMRMPPHGPQRGPEHATVLSPRSLPVPPAPPHLPVVGKAGGDVLAAAPAAAPSDGVSQFSQSAASTTGEFYAPGAGKARRAPQWAAPPAESEAGDGEGAPDGADGGERVGEKGKGLVGEEGAETEKKPAPEVGESSGSLYAPPALAERGRFHGLVVVAPQLGEGHVQAQG
jgi:hypothetical protein